MTYHIRDIPKCISRSTAHHDGRRITATNPGAVSRGQVPAVANSLFSEHPSATAANVRVAAITTCCVSSFVLVATSFSNMHSVSSPPCERTATCASSLCFSQCMHIMRVQCSSFKVTGSRVGRMRPVTRCCAPFNWENSSATLGLASAARRASAAAEAIWSRDGETGFGCMASMRGRSPSSA